MTLRTRLERLEEGQGPAAILLCLLDWHGTHYALRYAPLTGVVRELATEADLRQPVKGYRGVDPEAV